LNLCHDEMRRINRRGECSFEALDEAGGASEAFVVNEESHALKWIPVGDIAQDPHADESVRRMARKWLDRKALG